MNASSIGGECTSASLHRGTCSVLEQAVLTQACRAVLALYHLHFIGSVSVEQLSSASPTTTTVYRTSHLNAAVRGKNAVGPSLVQHQQHKAVPQHTSGNTSSLSAATSLSVKPPAGLLLFASTAEAEDCLRESTKYSLLTAIHLLRCSAKPYERCLHQQGFLADLVGRLWKEGEAWRAAAVLHASRLVLHRWKQDAVTTELLQHACDVSNEGAAHVVAPSTAAGACSSSEARQWLENSALSKRGERRVWVSELLLQVFPGLGFCTASSPLEPDGAGEENAASFIGNEPIGCGCPHRWFREDLPRWLLDASLEEHAVVWADGALVRRAFNQWRRRRGFSVLRQLLLNTSNNDEQPVVTPPPRVRHSVHAGDQRSETQSSSKRVAPSATARQVGEPPSPRKPAIGVSDELHKPNAVGLQIAPDEPPSQLATQPPVAVNRTSPHTPVTHLRVAATAPDPPPAAAAAAAAPAAATVAVDSSMISSIAERSTPSVQSAAATPSLRAAVATFPGATAAAPPISEEGSPVDPAENTPSPASESSNRRVTPSPPEHHSSSVLTDEKSVTPKGELAVMPTPPVIAEGSVQHSTEAAYHVLPPSPLLDRSPPSLPDTVLLAPSQMAHHEHLSVEQGTGASEEASTRESGASDAPSARPTSTTIDQFETTELAAALAHGFHTPVKPEDSRGYRQPPPHTTVPTPRSTMLTTLLDSGAGSVHLPHSPLHGRENSAHEVEDSVDDEHARVALHVWRRQELSRVFFFWRDRRYYVLLAARYVNAVSREHRLHECWNVWKKRVFQRYQARKEALERRCDAYVQQKATVNLQTALRKWRDAALVKRFSLQTFGRRVLSRWLRAALFRQRVLGNTDESLVTIGDRAVANDVLFRWRSKLREVQASVHYESALKRRAWRRLCLSAREHHNIILLQQRIEALQVRQAWYVWRRTQRATASVRGIDLLRQLRTCRLCFDRWQARSADRRERAGHALAVSQRNTQRCLRSCFYHWTRRASLECAARTLADSHRQRVLTFAWKQWSDRFTWRCTVRDDREQFADAWQERALQRRVLRVWRHVTAAAAHKRLDLADAADGTKADNYRARRVFARTFFWWRAAFFLSRHRGIDVRRALPSHAFQGVVPLSPPLRSHLDHHPTAIASARRHVAEGPAEPVASEVTTPTMESSVTSAPPTVTESTPPTSTALSKRFKRKAATPLFVSRSEKVSVPKPSGRLTLSHQGDTKVAASQGLTSVSPPFPPSASEAHCGSRVACRVPPTTVNASPSPATPLEAERRLLWWEARALSRASERQRQWQRQQQQVTPPRRPLAVLGTGWAPPLLTEDEARWGEEERVNQTRLRPFGARGGGATTHAIALTPGHTEDGGTGGEERAVSWFCSPDITVHSRRGSDEESTASRLQEDSPLRETGLNSSHQGQPYWSRKQHTSTHRFPASPTAASTVDRGHLMQHIEKTVERIKEHRTTSRTESSQLQREVDILLSAREVPGAHGRRHGDVNQHGGLSFLPSSLVDSTVHHDRGR